MKKLFFGLCAIVLLGAGCATFDKTLNEETVLDSGTQEVQAGWYLSFDYPNENWVMVRDYTAGNESVPLDIVVTTDLTDVVLQSTHDAVWFSSGRSPEQSMIDSFGNIVTEDIASIHVYRLDGRRAIPSEAEDLGSGFYREKLCEDGGECEIGGRLNYDYYLVSDSGAKYLFQISADTPEMQADAIDVLMSAKEEIE